MRKAWLVLLSTLIIGCASQPHSQATPPTPPRAEPLQAMEACRTESVHDACKFRPEFANLTEDEKLAMMRNCFEIIGPEFRACAAKHERLKEWVRGR